MLNSTIGYYRARHKQNRKILKKHKNKIIYRQNKTYSYKNTKCGVLTAPHPSSFSSLSLSLSLCARKLTYRKIINFVLKSIIHLDIFCRYKAELSDVKVLVVDCV
jgi:hypothetical protein